ncbi:DUF3408 domain-containing protein [Bacteroides fragilis]|nr:DUF3408 domain-containing protein [Bacteroides fragilis]
MHGKRKTAEGHRPPQTAGGRLFRLFLRRNEIKTRQCVYISRDVHSKILKIVNDIAGREISVGGYVDTVLRQHLEQHKEKINELYKKQREDLI